jgi:hypothetical protein
MKRKLYIKAYVRYWEDAIINGVIEGWKFNA